MKTTNRFFQTLLALLFVVSVSSCSKEEEVSPVLAARVEGTYTVTQISIGGKVSNVTADTKGQMTVTRLTETTVTLGINISHPTQPIKGSVSDITLTDAGGGEVTLTKPGSDLGRGGNNKLAVNFTDTDGTKFTLIGTK